MQHLFLVDPLELQYARSQEHDSATRCTVGMPYCQCLQIKLGVLYSANFHLRFPYVCFFLFRPCRNKVIQNIQLTEFYEELGCFLAMFDFERHLIEIIF